jgi:hypothetical protein
LFFYEKIGNEPAFRRAFRLWIEYLLIDNRNKVTDLIKESINDQTIEKYWSDEILVSVFKSDDCSTFFSIFEKELLENNAFFLNKCLHIIKTTCKEINLKIKSSTILLPIGSGWAECLCFIRNHILILDNQRSEISNFLFEWENLLIFQELTTDIEKDAVKEIIIHFFNQIESNDKYWHQNNLYKYSNKLISLLYNIAPFAKIEIENLVERAFKYEEANKFGSLNTFYSNVIKKIIIGIGNHVLIKEFPELIIATLWKAWKYKKTTRQPNKNSISYFIGEERLKRDECWGIKETNSFYPSGIYKTPIYYLLWFHQNIALKFIVDFLNYSVDFYVKAESNYKYEIFEIELELNDGTKIKQWAAWELWAAYRGLSVTSYAIESILMSLEKYLLELAELRTENGKLHLKSIFNYLLAKSNNVFITSVLTSVTIAYPEEVEEEMLPLLYVKEFYDWDLKRALDESSALAPYDDDVYFAQKERWKSNQLPHRKKYSKGLIDFIINYQFNIGTLNEKIHKLFDSLNSKLNKDDLLWKKTLNEIDIRNWEVGNYNDKLGGIVIQPNYDQDVSEYISTTLDTLKTQNTSLNYSSIILKAYEEKEIISIEKWLEIYTYYSKSESLNILYDKPIMLAIIGLRDFNNKLIPDSKNWCIDMLVDTIFKILQDEFNREFGFNKHYSFMEKEIALNSFHYLFNSTIVVKDINKLISLIIYMLFAPFNNVEVNKIINYIRNVFFKLYPSEGKRVWVGLIKYSKFRKTNPYNYDDLDKKRLKEKIETETEFIKTISSSNNLDIDLKEVDLNKNEGLILMKAFLITPYSFEDSIFKNFIKRFIPLLLEYIKIDYIAYPEKRIHFEATKQAELYIPEILLKANVEFSKNIIDLILAPIYSKDFKFEGKENDLFDFVSNILKQIIFLLYDITIKSTEVKNTAQIIENFWCIWEYLFEKVKNSGKHFFISTLLLDVKLNSELSHWVVIENKKEFFHKLIVELGVMETQSILNLFSTFGEKTFLPDGIIWLVTIFKINSDSTISLKSKSAEILIKKLFYNHISIIKDNKALIDDFIWILNKMVEFDSSEAYFLRENTIIYKKI